MKQSWKNRVFWIKGVDPLRIIIKRISLTLGYIAISLALFPSTSLMDRPVRAEPLTEQAVRRAAETWVRYVTADAKPNAVINRMEPYEENGHTMAYIAHIANGGFCLCAKDDLLLPVYLYSPENTFDPENPGYQYVLYEIAERMRLLTEASGQQKNTLLRHKTSLLRRKRMWKDLFSGHAPASEVSKESSSDAPPDMMELALTTTWDQFPPYNNACPMGDGGRTVVGCAATAMAQIMRYWEWPPFGMGNSSYLWDGDQSCGGDVGGGTLSATYSDPYDWQNMPDDCTGGCTQMEESALSELCYEIGVSVRMDYGRCSSGTPLHAFVEEWNQSPLINKFLYDSDATYNSDYEPPLTDPEEIINEIQWLRPVEVGGCLNSNGAVHYWVIRGYNKGTDTPQFLNNMGDGGSSVWRTWDQIANTCHNYIIQIAPQHTVRFVGNNISGDGSPDNPHRDIEEAIQQAPEGATLIFKAGTDNLFSAETLIINKPLTLKGKNITIQQQ